MEDKTESLNQCGAFLQIHLIKELKKYRWHVNSEYPVHISPFLNSPNNDDSIKQELQRGELIIATDFVKAVKNSIDKTIVKESSIDIIADKQTSNQRICHLCIKSKKLPQFVDWVFFNQSQQYNNLRLLVRGNNIPNITFFQIPKTKEYPVGMKLGICITPKKSFDYPICDFGIALKNKKIDASYYKSDNTTINDAARQIIEGMYGHVVDTILKYGPTANPCGDTICFFPIVVTHANLFVCKIDPNDINSQTGKTDKDPKYQEVDSLIYECPVPNTAQLSELSSAPMDFVQNMAIRKWHVLICSPKGFVELLEKIKDDGCFDLMTNSF